MVLGLLHDPCLIVLEYFVECLLLKMLVRYMLYMKEVVLNDRQLGVFYYKKGNKANYHYLKYLASLLYPARIFIDNVVYMLICYRYLSCS